MKTFKAPSNFLSSLSSPPEIGLSANPPEGVLASSFAGYVPLASQNPYPIKSILWPAIDPILVTFGQMSL